MQGHQFLMCAKFYHVPLLENANAIGMPNCGESMRDQDGCAMSCGREQTLEDFGLAAYIELGCWLIEQHDTRARLHREQRSRQRHALPLTA